MSLVPILVANWGLLVSLVSILVGYGVACVPLKNGLLLSPVLLKIESDIVVVVSK